MMITPSVRGDVSGKNLFHVRVRTSVRHSGNGASGDGSGPFEGHDCQYISSFSPWDLLMYSLRALSVEE